VNNKACLSLNQSREKLTRERRQTKESQYYEEQEECLYGPGIANLR